MTQELAEVLSASESQAGVATWLSGVRLVAIGDSVSLSMATEVLGQFGAALTRVDKVADVPNDADIVLVDRIESGSRAFGSPADYARSVAEVNRSVWVTVSAYGLGDDRAAARASEVTMLAAGGILGHTPGPQGAPPTIPAGSVALKLVGNVLVMAALHGLHEFRSGRRPVHLDLSGQGAIIATGLALEMSHALNDCPSGGGTARYGAPSGFFPCRDGSVYVLVLEQHQWAGFRGVLSPALDAIATIEDASERPDEVNSALERWTSTRSAAECESTLQIAGVPCTTVHSIESFLKAAAAAGRPVSAGDPLPAAIRVSDDVAAEPRRHIPLTELKVLDAGHVLAVPLAASWLGAMGAQVTKVEDPERLDIYRRRGPFAKGIAGLNRSAYFNHLNFSKRTIDLRVDPEGVSVDIEPYDVVMHNLSPHRADLLGVDPGHVCQAATPKMSLASSGFGRTGTWSEYRAYGTTIHAFAGLISATRNARGEMSGIGTPWADPLASVAATIWVLAWSLSPEKHRSIAVDVSMAESLAAHITDQIGVDPESNYLPTEFGGDFFISTPSGSLLALTIETAQEAQTFAQLIGTSVPLVSRRGQRFDVPLGDLYELSDAEIERLLQAGGLRASLVYEASTLARDQRLFDSEVFQFVESATLGRYPIAGLPWSEMGAPKRPLTAAPEHV